MMENMRSVGMALANVSTALSEITNDDMTRENLQANARQLELGAVRLAVLGNSNAGKSTLINALLRTIAVPESGNTASPIPVWFAAGDEAGEPKYSVYIRTEDGEHCEKPDKKGFIQRYCFNLMDITDEKRSRFSNVAWASAEIASPYLRQTGLTLIDTLGICATDADTAKTIATIDAGMDMVVFVTPYVTLRQSDITFLRDYVLGYGKRTVPYPIKPERLLLVYNDHGMNGASMNLFEQSADKLLAGAPDKEVKAFKKNNLLWLNALAARLVRCGAYDYGYFAPEGTLDFEKESLEKNTDGEKATLETAADRLKEEAASFDLLEKRLSSLARQLMLEQDGVVEPRIARLESEIDAIEKQTNKSISAAQGQVAAIRQKMSSVQAINHQFEEGNNANDQAFTLQRAAMHTAIMKTLAASEKSKGAMLGALRMLDRPSYINKETVKAYQSANDLEKEKTLLQWMRNILEESFLPEASRQFKKLLLEASVQAGNPNFTERDTIRYQINAARKLALDQNVRMRTFCEQLRANGAEDIGLTMPTNETIEAWFTGMASNMETAILEAIAGLRDQAYNKINAKLREIVKQIQRAGLIATILKSFGYVNINKFWASMRDRAVVRAADMICSEWFDPQQSGENSLYTGINAAYERVQDQVKRSLMKQTVQVESYLSELDKQLASQSANAKVVTTSMEGLQAKLKEQRAALYALHKEMDDLRRAG